MALLVLLAPRVVEACPICFQFEQGPVTAGMRVAILVLMGITTGVLTAFGVFIARFVRRTRQ